MTTRARTVSAETSAGQTGGPSVFRRAVILGNGYSGQLAAMALNDILPVKTMIGPGPHHISGDEPDGLNGQFAHSHIFLPRLEIELRRLDPEILIELAEQGLRFEPGSKRLTEEAPQATRRLFATRWQFDQAISKIFSNRLQISEKPSAVTDFQTDARQITRIELGSGDNVEISADTLVIDAMGTKSPIMKSLSHQVKEVTDTPGNIVYITQFFRLRSRQRADLPDPLMECAHNFGSAWVMLYPGADGWFSLSLAINIDNKALIREMRAPDAFISFCRNNPHVARWLDAADFHGANRLFINPRNRWNVAVFASDLAPGNYLAVGDALTTMLPTLGANCSFAATHIRIARDLLLSQNTDLQAAFHQAVSQAQSDFFAKAQNPKSKWGAFVPYKQAPQNRWNRRAERWLRRLIGTDKQRIMRHLSDSSSL